MNQENQDFSLEEYRNYWVAAATSNPSQRPKNNPELVVAFWVAAGLPDQRQPTSPPKIQGLGELVRDYYRALAARGEADHYVEHMPWAHLAHGTGVLTDELWIQMCEINPYLWNYHCRKGHDDRETTLRSQYHGQEPAEGTVEAFRLHHDTTLIDAVNRRIASAATTLDPRLHRMLACVEHRSEERLLLACQYIERQQVPSLTRAIPEQPHRHEALAKMTASEFTVEVADELFFEIESKLAAEAADARFTSGEYELSLNYSVEGPSLVIEKGGKALQAVPAALKKTSGYQDLHVIYEALRTQCRRFRGALEKRMALASAEIISSPESHRFVGHLLATGHWAD